jgi:iron(III) transport system ATP-binding protein
MSDLVAVMNQGRVLQAAPPDLIYRQPTNPWVAAFVGDADFVSGQADGERVETPIGRFPTHLTGAVTVMVRPEAVHLSSERHHDGRVVSREYFGHDQLITVAMDVGVMLRARTGPWPVLDPGDSVGIEVTDVAVFPAGDVGADQAETSDA